MSLLIKGGGEAEVGGLYGMNVETLTDNKTLTPGTDKIYQYLDPGAANRIITLATAGTSTGDRFHIRHNGDYDNTYYLAITQIGVMEFIYAGTIREFIFDGTNWVACLPGTGELNNREYNVGIGSGVKAYDFGVVFGAESEGYGQGTAVGNWTYAYTYGVAVGTNAEGEDYGVALGHSSFGSSRGLAAGYRADSGYNYYSQALGYNSRCIRYAETSISIDGDSYQKNNVVQGRWSKATADATPIEMFCGGVANQRFTIRPSSVLAFRMIITARDNVAGHVAMYTVDNGLIKRDAANNTAMALAAVVTVVYEDDATWDVAVTADDVNDALIITVTGDATNPVQWAARLDGVETHF